MRLDYPFSAIVGQKTMKQALILTAIDPLIGGVLVFGERGTGKSTICSLKNLPAPCFSMEFSGNLNL